MRRVLEPPASGMRLPRRSRSAWAVALVITAAVSACSGGSPGPSSQPATRSVPQGGSATSAPSADPSALSWQTGPPMPVGVSEVAVAEVSGRIHVLGGYVGGRAHSTTHLVLAPPSGRWQSAAPLPERLDHIGAVGLNGILYAAG